MFRWLGQHQRAVVVPAVVPAPEFQPTRPSYPPQPYHRYQPQQAANIRPGSGVPGPARRQPQYRKAAPVDPTSSGLIEPPRSQVNVWLLAVYSQQGHVLGSLSISGASKQQAMDYAMQACQHPHYAGAAYVGIQNKGTNEYFKLPCYASVSGDGTTGPDDQFMRFPKGRAVRPKRGVDYARAQPPPIYARQMPYAAYQRAVLRGAEESGTLGAIDAATEAMAKAQLLTWTKTTGKNLNPLSSYGQVPEDFTTHWTARDRVVLSAFSKWWNSKKFSPILPEGEASGVGKQAILSESHAYALNQWSANQLPTAPPGFPAVPMPPPPPGWPPLVAWPPIGTDRPPGWPGAWPPPPPLGWPSTAPWPLPVPKMPGAPTGSLPSPPSPQVPAPKGPLPPPPKPLPGTSPQPPTGPLPPPPAPTAPAEKKTASPVLWVLGGVALFGVAVFALAPRKG